MCGGAPGPDHRGHQLRCGHDRGLRGPPDPGGHVSAVRAGDVALESPGASPVHPRAAERSLRRLWRVKWGLVAALLLLLIVATALAAPLIAPYSPVEVDIQHRL